MKYGLAFFVYDNEKENVNEIVAGIVLYPDENSPHQTVRFYRPGKYKVIYKAGNDRWPNIDFEVKDEGSKYIVDIDCITGDLQLTRTDSPESDHPVESPVDEGAEVHE